MFILANVKSKWRPKDGCPICHSNDNVILSGRSKPRLIRDVPRNNYCIQIITQGQRYECTECRQRFIPAIDGIVENKSMTERLLEYIKEESFLRSHTDLESITGLSIQTIQNIMDEEIDRYDAERSANPPEAPRHLGIDEKHICDVMRGTLVDGENGVLLDMLEDNSEKQFTQAIKKLKNWDTNIQVVTTDMANQYLRWLSSLLPNATIVIDKYHVIQDVMLRVTKTKNILYNYRKELIAKIENDELRQEQTWKLSIVNDNRRLFNYSMENIVRDTEHNRAQKLATVIDEFPEFRLLRMLYYLVENMYLQETLEDAEAAWSKWEETLPPSGKSEYAKWCELYSVDKKCFEAFQSFSRPTFQYFKPYILNYFKPGCRCTNAATEGLNNNIERINRAGNGLRFKHLRAKALYGSLLKDRVRYDLDIKTVQTWKPTFSFVESISSNQQCGEYVTETKYRFTKKKEIIRIPETNLDGNVDTLIEMLTPAVSGSNISYDEDDIIEGAWCIWEPNERMRRLIEISEECNKARPYVNDDEDNE